MSDSASRSETSNPIYFWRATETCGFLSQWYHAPFVAPAPKTDAPTMTFLTCEQYMMYHKAILFEDFGIAEQILETPDPSTHKALGRQVKGFDEKVWQKNRETIVEDGNWYKFSSSENSHLCKMLLETGDRELAEVRCSIICALWIASDDLSSVMLIFLHHPRLLPTTAYGGSGTMQEKPMKTEKDGALTC